ncbi:MAG: hypothetical protein RLY93_17165 [Sumerlaeia bacterium]
MKSAASTFSLCRQPFHNEQEKAPASQDPSPKNPLDLRRAEDRFIALATTPDMAFYLGRFLDASDDELRALFGLAAAAMRMTERQPLESTHPASAENPPHRLLESRLREMSEAIAERDERIRELNAALAHNRKKPETRRPRTAKQKV